MERQYLFIEGVHATGVAKRETRSHVMKGKNLGRKLRRRSKLAYAPEIAKSFGYLGVALPVEISPWSQQIINDCKLIAKLKMNRIQCELMYQAVFTYTITRIYPIHLGLVLHEVMVLYLQNICSDETVHACCIDLMQASNEIFSANGESPPKALHHISRTFAMVQQRLNGDDALSDSTLAIIISFFHQEQIRKHYAAARVHMEGLQRIVELRGGLSSLESSPYLMLKSCKIDIMFALQTGEPPMFFRNNMAYVQKVLAKDGLSLICSEHSLFERYRELNSALQGVLRDIMGSCSLFNNDDKKNVSLGMITLLELLISICYRLLRYKLLRSISGQHSDIEAALHLGSTIIMMTVFLQLGNRRMIEYGSISQCLEDVLNENLLNNDIGLYLWLAVTGNIWISGDGESGWIALRMKKASERSGLKSWEEVRSCIRTYPWINSIHDQPGEVAWQRASLASE